MALSKFKASIQKQPWFVQSPIQEKLSDSMALCYAMTLMGEVGNEDPVLTVVYVEFLPTKIHGKDYHYIQWAKKETFEPGGSSYWSPERLNSNLAAVGKSQEEASQRKASIVTALGGVDLTALIPDANQSVTPPVVEDSQTDQSSNGTDVQFPVPA